MDKISMSLFHAIGKEPNQSRSEKLCDYRTKENRLKDFVTVVDFIIENAAKENAGKFKAESTIVDEGETIACTIQADGIPIDQAMWIDHYLNTPDTDELSYVAGCFSNKNIILRGIKR
jgi:fructose-1,6-bisphosphatase/inositol monophosphatase family enzyme